MNSGKYLNQVHKSLLGLFVMLLLLAVLMPQALASSQSPAENYYLVTMSSPRFLPANINAGDTVSLAVDVTSGAVLLDVVDINAVLDLSNYFDSVTSSDSIALIRPGTTNTFLLKFKVKDSTPPGFYTINLNLNYLRDGAKINQKQTLTVPVSVGQKNLVVDLSPKTISPGNQTTLSYSLTNNGLTAVSNVLLTWSESTGLVLPLGADNRKFISRINPGETVSVNYLVAVDPNITTGIYPLDVEISYIDSNGAQSQKSTIGIIAGGVTDFDVSSEYTNNQLSFSIANVGSNNAAAVVVKLSRQSGLNISGSDTIIIGSLNKGDYSLANFAVTTASSDLNSVAGGAGAFRRNGGASSGPTVPSSSIPPTSVGSTGVQTQDRNFSASGVQVPSNYVVDIYYTDTTGERQQVQKNFSINSRASGFAAGLAGAASANGFGTDWVSIILVLVGVIVIGAGYNKFRAKKNWKQFALFTVFAVIVAVVAVFVAPGALLTPILVGAIVAVALIVLFLGRSKRSE